MSISLVDELRALLGDGAVLTAKTDIAAYLIDWRGRFSGEAACVVVPATTEQVAHIIKLCVAHRTPVIAQGGNTSLCGGAVPGGREGKLPVVVSLQRMRSIRSVDALNDSMVVDGGCILANVQEAAAEVGRLYPVSLGAEGSCTIAGTIATNAGGTGVLRYGNTRDNVLGLEVVLPDGTVWNGLYALRKNNTGYDLKHLFIGSEGTLGIITGAVLKLHTRPCIQTVAWVAVAGPEAALKLLSIFRAECAPQLSAFELLNGDQIRLVVEQVPGRRCPLANSGGWHLLVELSGTRQAEPLNDAMEKILARAMESELVLDAIIAASDAQRSALWEFRHSVSEANRKGGIGLTSDTAVPVSSVPAFIDAATKAVRKVIADLPIIVVCHMGDGNVHFIPFLTFDQWNGLEEKDATVGRIRRAVNDVAAGLGGTFSAEHGIGRSLLSEMGRYKPPAELALMRAVKQALDPEGLFNPGTLLPSAPSSMAS
jgi:FAD/FMN-containing dehydrogenase